MLCHLQGRKPPVFLPRPLFPGFPVPHQCSGVYPVELLRLRSVGRPPAAFFPRRSRLIARSPLILATVVARLLLLAGKSLFACDLRARRQPPRTRGVKLPQWASSASILSGLFRHIRHRHSRHSLLIKPQRSDLSRRSTAKTEGAVTSERHVCRRVAEFFLSVVVSRCLTLKLSGNKLPDFRFRQEVALHRSAYASLMFRRLWRRPAFRRWITSGVARVAEFFLFFPVYLQVAKTALLCYII